jgi:hypothetical protein
MGGIVYWTLIRLAVLIPLLWYFLDVIDYKFWWIISGTVFYFVIIHPVVVQSRKFKVETIDALKDTICAQCKHFDSTAALCMKYDEHPTPENIPCDGIHWEPR